MVLLCVAPALAQESTSPRNPVLTATRIPDGTPLRLDGVLDEEVWRSAQPADAFLQKDPDNGAPATQRTEVRVLFDADRVVFGATLYDDEPDRILGNQMQRDESFSADDRFIVTLDTFRDGRSGYIFQTNPLGALFDGLLSASTNSNDESRQDVGAAINRSWNGIWMARVRRGAEGWTAEIEIPFRTLNFNPELTAWGVNFQRTVRRSAEESLWTGYQRNEGVGNMSNAGRLEGLIGISQGVGLDVKPYVVGNLTAQPGRGAADRVSTGDVGVDLFYNLTPALRANLSVNTDFAETEVDERQINLTRFPLFFAEKRDFFLQGATYFDFAREIGDQVTPFFSRRIGLDGRGFPQPIHFGAKLTGQAGAFDIGFLQARTDDSPFEPGAEFTVARIRRRFLQESYAGVLYTRRDERSTGAPALPDGPALQTAGIDAALRTSRFMGNKTLEWSSWLLVTTNPLLDDAPDGLIDRPDGGSADEGGNLGRGSRLAFPNDPFYFDFSYRELQPNYRPAVGFVQRNGFRRYNPEVGYTWRFADHPWLRSLQHEIDWDFVVSMENALLTETKQFKPATVVFRDGSQGAYEVHPTYERLERDFEISDGVTLEAGKVFEFTRHEISGSMSDRYPVSVGGQVAFGRFFSGTHDEYQVDVSVRPRAGVALGVEAQHNVLKLAEGSFDTTVLRVTANTQFSPWLSLVNNVQYDDVSRLVGWQMRFRWIQRPGNDLFFVYTHNWQEFDEPEARAFRTLDSRAATKVVYTLRF